MAPEPKARHRLSICPSIHLSVFYQSVNCLSPIPLLQLMMMAAGWSSGNTLAYHTGDWECTAGRYLLCP